jgi:hypothetical protein
MHWLFYKDAGMALGLHAASHPLVASSNLIGHAKIIQATTTIKVAAAFLLFAAIFSWLSGWAQEGDEWLV